MEQCTEFNRNYSVIEALRHSSWLYRPATLKMILTALKAQRDLHPDETPSDLTVERLLGDISELKDNSIRKQTVRIIDEAEKELSTEWEYGYKRKDLTMFQIFRFQEEDSVLKQIHLNDTFNSGTRNTKFLLGYRLDPKKLALSKPTDTKMSPLERIQFVQHQISAIWQFILDLILDHPNIDITNAERLHSVLKSHCTLGEIPDHMPMAKDREHINFLILSQLTKELHSVEKYQNKDEKISCLRITMGEYAVDSSGTLTLTDGQVICGYPLQTRFYKENYYVAVAVPGEEKELNCRYLRVDHIRSCEVSSAHSPRKFSSLPAPTNIETALYGDAVEHYAVADCPEATFVEIIDSFGKNSLHNCRKTNDLWNFTITIPASRKKLLKALHEEHLVTEHKCDNDSRSTATPHLDLAVLKAALDTIKPNPTEMKFNTFKLLFDIDTFSPFAKSLVEAIRNQDRHKIQALLTQKAEQLSPLEAAWCCYLGMAMDAEIFESILRISPHPESFIYLLPATVPMSSEGTHLNLVSVAAYYNRLDLMKLLIEYGAPTDTNKEHDAPPLRVAIREGHVDCLNYLLFECSDVDKTVDDDMLTLFARAASNGRSLKETYKIAAPVLLGCNVSVDGYSPFPEGMTTKHIAKAMNMPLLLQYCKLHPGELTPDDAKLIQDSFLAFPFADTHPEGFVRDMAVIARACPSILRMSQCKYLLAVAGLQKGAMPAQLPALLKSVPGPYIVMQDYAYHNWFGRDGMIHRWDRLNDPSIERKSPLLPAIYRNTPPPCDPKAVSTEVMDTILTRFKILGKAKEGTLSVLARYALKFASKENIAKALQPGGFLVDEDPAAMQLYIESLQDSSSMSNSQRSMLIDLFNKKS